jgi:hypothetical protein
MNEYDDNEEQEEEELDEKEVSDEHQDKNNDQIVKQPDDEETKLQNDLAKEFINTLKIAVNNQLPDIGPTQYKVAIIGMNELGSATAFLLICRQIVTDVIIIDRNAKRLAGINIKKPKKKSILI